jgi:hypothetical protein
MTRAIFAVFPDFSTVAISRAFVAVVYFLEGLPGSCSDFDDIVRTIRMACATIWYLAYLRRPPTRIGSKFSSVHEQTPFPVDMVLVSFLDKSRLGMTVG